MDIASLLSKDDGTQNPSSSRKRPHGMARNHTPSHLSQEILISPSPEPPRTGGADALEAQVHAGLHLPQAMDISSSVSPYRSPMLSALDRPDLRAARSPSNFGKHIGSPQLGRTHSDHNVAEVMADAPAQTPPPRNLRASSISEADLQTINELMNHLADNSYDYSSHVQLINLLHRGFIAHTETIPSTNSKPSQPSDYPLLRELRMARGAMESRFSVGEDIWRDWITDESILVTSSEERTAVMELCIKAVQEEPCSTILWSLYGEWVWSTYAIASGFSEDEGKDWTEEDMMICREVFNRELVLSVWTQAVEATKWRIDESHVIWNRYVELIMQDFPEQPGQQTIDEVQMLYMARLQVPHLAFEATSQAFWPFISKYNPDGWEEVMAAVNELSAPSKKEISTRIDYEQQISQALQQNDTTQLYNVFTAYLDWEAKPKKKATYPVELRSALYERALLRFPNTIEWWLDYTDCLTYHEKSGTSVLSLLERATRHCPWSGELWARRLLRVEIETQNYEEVEGVKHKATNSGLLPIGGMEEILVLYSAWCSFLRRRAFAPTASDDDVDMADMAISGVLTDIQYDGKKTYGEEFRGDPLWRIEQIFIQFLSQARRINEARDFWGSLIHTLGSSYHFWGKWYDWEILMWGWEGSAFKNGAHSALQTPHRASAVLREAMSRRDLDWPEKIHEIYANHFNTHETVAEIQKAQVELRRARKFLKLRREREAAEVETQAAQANTDSGDAMATDADHASGKRKREEEAVDQEGQAAKRSREESAPEAAQSPSTAAAAQLKRDREHTTISVTGLPPTITEKNLRQFFRDCGKILSLSITSGEKPTATIEFETDEDVQAAKTRDAKKIDGHEVHIQHGTLSTLYVTNYPPSWSEDDVRNLFKDYGTITSIRFPSLKFNQRRRFCYVQYLTAEEAQSATQLHDKVIDGQHRLVALISDPYAKKSRAGATAEGREVHVGNIEHSATEQEIRAHFGAMGRVENVRMMKAANGRFTGSAFVIFSSADEAQTSLTLDQKPLHSRLLRVSLATDKSSRDAANKKHGSTRVYDAAEPSAAANGASPAAEADDPSALTKRERTLALLELPQTVNETRVHDLFAAFGPIRRVVIRRDKGGALVEFVNLEDVGKASLAADAQSLGEGCRVGEAAELFGPAPKKGAIKPALVSRPVQRPGQRGGRKPGLGCRAGPAGKPEQETEGKDKKSNEDFRNMFLAGKEGEKE